jgi:hypothetical protein
MNVHTLMLMARGTDGRYRQLTGLLPVIARGFPLITFGFSVRTCSS